MENLVSQVPELKLRKRTETKVLHRNDLSNPEYKGKKAGDVITLVWYTDEKGKQWFKADVMYYIQLQAIIDRENELVDEPEMEMV